MAFEPDPGQTPIDWAILTEHYLVACRAIRRRMPRGLRAGYDAEDFVSDAIVDVMTHPASFAKYGPVLLFLVAKRRMIDAARSPRNRSKSLQFEKVDHRPSAALTQEAGELRELMLGRASNPRERQDLDLRCQGHTLPEIAEFSGVPLRTVQRFFKRFAEAHEPC